MIFTDEIEDWLPWVIKIRFVIIVFVFAIDYAIHSLAPNPANAASIRYLGIAVILWLILSLFFLIYNQIRGDYTLQAYLQIYCDIVIITAIVHVTGDLDSNYFSLYLVTIILASTLFPRGRAFLVAAVSFVCMGAMIEFAYLPTIYPELGGKYPALQFLTTTSSLAPDLTTLQVKISASLFGFFAVAYLSSYLSESLRKAGRELRDKSGQVANLQAKNENIIQSMREGLLSTDLKGAITELNPAGAEILGHKIDELRGSQIDTVFPGSGQRHSFPSGSRFPHGPAGDKLPAPAKGAPHFGNFLVSARGARGRRSGIRVQFPGSHGGETAGSGVPDEGPHGGAGPCGGGHCPRNSQSSGFHRRVGKAIAVDQSTG